MAIQGVTKYGETEEDIQNLSGVTRSGPREELTPSMDLAHERAYPLGRQKIITS